MGRFEVLNLRGHEGGKYLSLFAGGTKSSIVGDHFNAILIPQLSTAQAGEVLHMFIACFTWSITTCGGLWKHAGVILALRYFRKKPFPLETTLDKNL